MLVTTNDILKLCDLINDQWVHRRLTKHSDAVIAGRLINVYDTTVIKEDINAFMIKSSKLSHIKRHNTVNKCKLLLKQIERLELIGKPL